MRTLYPRSREDPEPPGVPPSLVEMDSGGTLWFCGAPTGGVWLPRRPLPQRTGRGTRENRDVFWREPGVKDFEDLGRSSLCRSPRPGDGRRGFSSDLRCPDPPTQGEEVKSRQGPETPPPVVSRGLPHLGDLRTRRSVSEAVRDAGVVSGDT